MEGEKRWATLFQGKTNRKRDWLIQRHRRTDGQTDTGTDMTGSEQGKQGGEEKNGEADTGAKGPRPHACLERP